ncbi:hypothetical protein D3C81_1907260 [compost metagenome]
MFAIGNLPGNGIEQTCLQGAAVCAGCAGCSGQHGAAHFQQGIQLLLYLQGLEGVGHLWTAGLAEVGSFGWVERQQVDSLESQR